MRGRVFDTRRHSNIRKKAEYRRITVYRKSLGRFKAEKARRQRILTLQAGGLTIKQIALQLGVGERTVKRDLAKMKTYVTGLRNRGMYEAEQEGFEFFKSLNEDEQIDYIKKSREIRERAFKAHSCKSLVITIDVDRVFGGRYTAVKFKPDLPVEVADNGRITLQLQAHGRTQPIARVYVGKFTPGSLNLQTNQSMNQFITPTLKGLEVVESSSKEPEETSDNNTEDSRKTH